MIEELARDYSSYVKVDLNSELHNVQDTIDDMLTRLDEFESLVNMVRTDGDFCADAAVPQILECKNNLDSLCSKIDGLHHLVNHIKSNLLVIETQVDEAEKYFGQNNKTFKNIFKPLLFASTELPSRTDRRPPYEAPVIFSTSSYFPEKSKDSCNG